MFSKNPDSSHKIYSTKYGIYEPNCGLDSVMLSWRHDEISFPKDFMNWITIHFSTCIMFSSWIIVTCHLKGLLWFNIIVFILGTRKALTGTSSTIFISWSQSSNREVAFMEGSPRNHHDLSCSYALLSLCLLLIQPLPPSVVKKGTRWLF